MKKINEKILFQGRWLAIKESEFEHKQGHLCKWESVVRKNNTSSVIIVAKLIPSQRIILIKQFRPAINGYVLGFPAGLGNDSDEEIIEELKEETGYTGVIVEKGPLIKSGSGIIDDSGRSVLMAVDERDPVNQDPKQKLEPSEDIEVILLPVKEVKDYLLAASEQGVAVGGGLWYAFGVSEWLRTEDVERDGRGKI